MVYVVNRLPINEDKVYRAVFPRLAVADDPEELVRQKLVIVDTRFQNAKEFQGLARMLRNQRIPCVLVTNLPFQPSESEIAQLEAFRLSLFFEEDRLVDQPFAREAARRSIELVCKAEISFMPRIATLGYIELEVNEDSIPHALIALRLETESFNSCRLIAQRAKSLNQYKTVITCPRYLEIKVQELTRNAVVLDDNSENIKVARIYWLNQQQLLETITERHRRVMARTRSRLVSGQARHINKNEANGE